MASKSYRPKPPLSEPVPIYKQVQIGETRTASDGLMVIGQDFDGISDGDLVRGHYEFEMDGHKILVHVVPIEPLQPTVDPRDSRYSTPFDSDEVA